jgi:lipoprotein NlpI
MLRFFCIGLLWLMGMSAACASAYDDYSQGLAAKNRGDFDFALTKFTAALNAPDLNPELIPVAHVQRGRLRLHNLACAEALEDFEAALKAKPGDLAAIGGRGVSYSCLGKHDLALADYTAVIAASPDDADTFRTRALEYWSAGNFTSAIQDLTRVTQLAPKYSYGWLWLEILRARTGNLDAAQTQKDLRNIDLDTWPLPAFQLFAKQITPDGLIAAAAKDAGEETKGRQCEANFYGAEWWLTQKKTDMAKPMLEQASKTCPLSFVERSLAISELDQE